MKTKKKIFYSALVLSCGVFFAVSSKPKEMLTKALNFSLEKKSEREVQALENGDLSQKQFLEHALKKAPSLESLEKNFKNYSNEELQTAISLNENEILDNQLIDKANKSELDKKMAYLLVEKVRIGQALNKVLLDRKMGDFERKHL